MLRGMGMLILSNVALFIVALGAIYFGLTVYGIILFVLGVVTMPQLHALLDKHDGSSTHIMQKRLTKEQADTLMKAFGMKDEEEEDEDA